MYVFRGEPSMNENHTIGHENTTDQAESENETGGKKVKLGLSIHNRSTYADITQLGETEETMLERARKLRERHEKLLEENETYAALYHSLPDRSDFVSGVPIIENAVVPMINTYSQIFYYVREKARWSRRANRLKRMKALERKKNVDD
jgi:hypothetical protein